MKELTIKDFVFEQSEETIGHRFYKKLKDGREINLEACFSGYDVALYDSNLDIIGEKICTEMNQNVPMDFLRHMALDKAVQIANQILK